MDNGEKCCGRKTFLTATNPTRAYEENCDEKDNGREYNDKEPQTTINNIKEDVQSSSMLNEKKTVEEKE